uniref:Ig-like domain-containing protein n=1 Tax=Cynoglossus semilaevis TaxID=244447 RepID=A0A3P8WDX5_CYNSE
MDFSHVGETAVFTVKVLSFPKPFVQWFHEGQVITSSSVHMFLHKQDEYSLVIKQVQRESEGQYSCTFRNRFGQCSCTSYLQVQPERADKDTVPTGKAPEFIKRIESVQVSEGGSACLRYQVCGEPQPHIEWLHGSVCLQPSDLCEVVNNLDGSGFIHIKVVKQEHSGTYTLSNDVGTSECSTELLVLDKPNFVKPLGPVVAVMGTPLHLECQVDEDTGVSVTWTRDGRKVHQSPDCKLSFEDKVVTLDILKASVKDCGNYVCTVTNEAGSATCSTLVKVQGKICPVVFVPVVKYQSWRISFY